MDLRRYVIPAIHRLLPSPGPGGLTGLGFSRLTGVDASNMVHVTRMRDVRDVLEREDDFSVRVYDERMKETTGAFILGIPQPERYFHDLTIIQAAVRREDVALVRSIAQEEAERAIARVRGKGRIELVTELAELVPARFVLRYYGLPYSDAVHLIELFKRTSAHLFSFWLDPALRADAIAASLELKQILESAIAQRRQQAYLHDRDVLARMLAAQPGFADGDTGIVRSIAGLASGNLIAPSGLFARSVDTLLGLDERTRGELHELAKGSARAHTGEDELTLLAYLREAQRFNVYPGTSYRYAERDTVIAQGTKREKQIAKGTRVVTWQLLTAFDGDTFERPFDFIAGRPRELYLNFGHGRHRCLGEHIGQILIEEMARALLALPRLRRAPGKAGTLQSLPVRQAAYAASLVLEFAT